MSAENQDIKGTYSPTPIAGKLALITGATGGIGRATAQLLASRGVHLALHFRSSAPAAGELAASLAQAHGVRAQAYQCDLGDYDAVRTMHADIVREMGEIEILYNNAADEGSIMGLHGRIEDVSMKEMENCWRVNTGAAFLLAQLIIPAMARAGYGRVVFCTSVAAATGGVVGPHYAGSKSALHGIMHWIAKNYARDGVTCNAVSPALITNTNMFANPTMEHRNLIPLGRFGQPEEVAQVVELLISNAYMTNKIIAVDGGMQPSAYA
ncbi:NAD(P)-binding protein [Peniophora sp. CONT]|nr:NAD(P)-binding protein [Peniophora sp. CONT]